MATAPPLVRLHLGPNSAGMFLTAEEFDLADFEPGVRYELINEVLVVTPAPSRKERDPNEELGRWLRNYQESHPEGAALDATLAEETVHTGDNRRRGDRAIWAGLGRLPAEDEAPTIVVEFVSEGRANRKRDYETKRHEYRTAGVREYWIIDRALKTMTVITFTAKREKERVLKSTETYTTSFLPGFELRLSKLFALADRWSDKR